MRSPFRAGKKSAVPIANLHGRLRQQRHFIETAWRTRSCLNSAPVHRARFAGAPIRSGTFRLGFGSRRPGSRLSVTRSLPCYLSTIYIEGAEGNAEHCPALWMVSSIRAQSDCQPATDQNIWATAETNFGLTISASLRVALVTPRGPLTALCSVILALLLHDRIQGAKGEAERCSRPWMASFTAVATMSFGLTVRSSFRSDAHPI